MALFYKNLVLTNPLLSLDDVRLYCGVDVRELRYGELEADQEWL